jgi:hypothetical protein
MTPCGLCVALELKEREGEWNLERKENVRLRLSEGPTLSTCGEGYLYLQHKRPHPGCGSGIQWVKDRPSFTVLLNLILIN